MEDQGGSLDERQDIADVGDQLHSQNSSSLPWRGRRLHVASEAVHSYRVVHPVGGPEAKEICARVVDELGEVLLQRLDDELRGGGEAFRPRGNCDQPTHTLRSGGGEQRKRAGAVEAPHQDGLLGARCVNYRQRVVRVGFERQVLPNRIGHSGVPPIKTDHPREPAEALEESGGLRDVPNRLEVRGDSAVEHEVAIARTVHLISDGQLATVRVPGPRTIHQANLSNAGRGSRRF